MDINDIKIFCALADINSTMQVAETLGYTQSNVSKRIAKLEAELGCTLFVRSNKGMYLNENGKAIIDNARELLKQHINMQQHLQSRKEQVRIGTTQVIARVYLSSYYANHNYELFVNTIDNLKDMLKQEKIDVLISNVELHNAALKEILVKSEEIGFLKSAYNGNGLQDKLILINRDSSCPYRQATIGYMNRHNIRMERLIEVDTLDIMMTMLLENDAIAMLPIQMLDKNKKLMLCKGTSLQSGNIHIYSLKSNLEIYNISI